MVRKCTLPSILLSVLFLLPFSILAASSSVRAISQGSLRYSKAHSLGDHYDFDPRDGWQSVNATNSLYNYSRDTSFNTTNPAPVLGPRNGKKENNPKFSVGEIIGKAWAGIKAIGQPQTVKITWYTGHDLENPSCWPNGKWKPTDASFACALTLHGWENRPQCFKFIELCNTPKKCVFVRVVDSCAGCTPGSRHVDLTRAAFRQLADFDDGALYVHLRLATYPTNWYEELWGPR